MLTFHQLQLPGYYRQGNDGPPDGVLRSRPGLYL